MISNILKFLRSIIKWIGFLEAEAGFVCDQSSLSLKVEHARLNPTEQWTFCFSVLSDELGLQLITKNDASTSNCRVCEIIPQIETNVGQGDYQHSLVISEQIKDVCDVCFWILEMAFFKGNEEFVALGIFLVVKMAEYLLGHGATLTGYVSVLSMAPAAIVFEDFELCGRFHRLGIALLTHFWKSEAFTRTRRIRFPELITWLIRSAFARVFASAEDPGDLG